jgi:hypothetical protein
MPLCHRIDPSDYMADPPHHLQSECICLHVSLNSLEVLGDLKNGPESPELYQDMINHPSPFYEIYKTCSAMRLDALSLTEVDGVPWVTFVKRAGISERKAAAPFTDPSSTPEEIVFKDLDADTKRTMRCRMWEVVGDEDNACFVLLSLKSLYSDNYRLGVINTQCSPYP